MTSVGLFFIIPLYYHLLNFYLKQTFKRDSFKRKKNVTSANIDITANKPTTECLRELQGHVGDGGAASIPGRLISSSGCSPAGRVWSDSRSPGLDSGGTRGLSAAFAAAKR